MGRKVIDRTGEINYNNFGSKMVIKEYRGAKDLDIYFPEYDWIFKHVQYDKFKKGNIKCVYEPRYFNVGYLGEGKYKVEEDAFQTYKQYKEKIIKEVINSYEGKIPEPHYSRLKVAMYNYKVEIDD